MVNEKFPKVVLSPHVNQYEGWLAQYNDALLANYYSITATTATSEIVRFYSEIAFDEFEKMIAITSAASLAYEENGDHTQLFESCAQSMSSFLTSITRVFASQANFIGPKNPNTPLSMRLAQLELTKWANLFESDLSAFMSKLEDRGIAFGTEGVNGCPCT